MSNLIDLNKRRLEYRDNARIADSCAQCSQRHLYGCGVVGEVIVQRIGFIRVKRFQASLGRRKVSHGLCAGRNRRTGVYSGCNGCHGVVRVVFPEC